MTRFYKLIHSYSLIALSLILLASCNDTEDVGEIITGKTWKLTFISTSNNTGNWDRSIWQKSSNPSDAFDKSIKSLREEGTFSVTFELEDSSKDESFGKINGKGASRFFSGSWRGNGNTNAFSCNISNEITELDLLGKELLDGLRKAERYEGDVNNLTIYYNNGKNLLMFRKI